MKAQALFLVLIALQLLLVVLVTCRHKCELDRERKAAELAAANAEHGISLQQRADAVAAASQAALDNLRRAKAIGDDDSRKLWLSIQCASSDEIQDVALAIRAGVK